MKNLKIKPVNNSTSILWAAISFGSYKARTWSREGQNEETRRKEQTKTKKLTSSAILASNYIKLKIRLKTRKTQMMFYYRKVIMKRN